MNSNESTSNAQPFSSDESEVLDTQNVDSPGQRLPPELGTLNGTSDATGNFDSEELDDPHRLARSFLESRFTHSDGTTLVYWRGEWHVWDGLKYRPIKTDELKAQVTDHVKQQFDHAAKMAIANWNPEGGGRRPTARKVTRSLVGNVLQALESVALIDGQTDQPHYRGVQSPVAPEFTFPMANCLLDLDAIEKGEAQFVPPTPMFFSPRAVDYEFDPDADCPEWIRFLKSVWPTDVESVETLQEFFDLCLTNDTSFHKFVLLVGPPRSGKGTIGRVLTRLIGVPNVASPTLSNLAGRFGLSPLLGKSVAVVPDARLSGRSDSVGIVERLLSIVGEDPQDIDRKCLEPLTAVRLAVRFLVMTNEVPTLPDSSSAIVTRTLLIRMTETFLGKEDPALEKKLLAELPGILNWAIAGWQRLQNRGRFKQPASGQELIDEFRRQSSPVGEFVEDCCEVGKGKSVPVAELYSAYCEWCEQHGRDHPGTEATFGKSLRSVVHSLSTKRPGSGASRKRVYSGIALQKDSQISLNDDHVQGVHGHFQSTRKVKRGF